MFHLGDITKIKGYEAPVVDCIIGGSPCQDLSVAGKRAGLAGERSGLFMEQIRVIKEMRENDSVNGRSGVDVRPRYGIWENVPGALSSPGKGHAGEDFAAVLEEFVRVAEPEAPTVSVPEKGWPTAGCLYDEMGKWSVAWRIMDSQYWGVPQRRRRICLVADFNGLNAPKIVFGEAEHHGSTERGGRNSSVGHSGVRPRPQVRPVTEGVSGNPDSCQPQGQETAGDAGDSVGGAIPYTLEIRGGCEGGGKGALIQEDKSATLSTLQDQTLFQPVTYGHGQSQVFCLQGGGATSQNSQGMGYKGDTSYTLNTTDRHAVAYGIGSYHSNAWKSDNPNSGIYEADTAKTLDSLNCGYPGCNQGGMAVVQPVTLEPGIAQREGGHIYEGVCGTLRANAGDNQMAVAYGIQGSMVGRADKNGPQGDGVNEDVSFTLNTTDRHAVAYAIDQQGGKGNAGYAVDVMPTLCSDSHGTPHAVAYSIENHPADSRVDIDDSGKVQTLTSRMGTGGGNVPMVMEPKGFEMQAFGQYKDSGCASSLKARDYKDATDLVVAGVDCRNATELPEQNITLQSSCSHNLNSGGIVRVKHIVRRLTPLECERLQGFPDGWTDIGEWIDSKGKKHKEADSPRYKALGNSIALPPWKWVLQRLCACYERDATMASLFDGIGGFPLIWEQINGKGSCLWASEVEEFPIAVTKLRFGGNG